MQKLICLDYDGSYTEFTDMFDLIIKHCREKNYKVIMCTMRYPIEKDIHLTALESKLDGLYFTSRKAKEPFLKELGIIPNLWIDDKPYWLYKDG